MKYQLGTPRIRRVGVRTSVTAMWVAATLVWSTTSAHAYIDPGTGSIIIQALVGAVVAGGVAVKMYWTRLKRFFFGIKENDKSSGT